MSEERQIWEIGLSSWIIQDGNYGDFEAGRPAEFALEFSPKSARVCNDKHKSAKKTGPANYAVCAEVVFLGPGTWVLDFGIRCYHDGQPPDGLRVGDYVQAELFLGIDPFFTSNA